MAIEDHYYKALEAINGMLKRTFSGIHDESSARGFGLAGLDPRISFQEGVHMLIDSSWTDKSGNPPSPLDDLHTRQDPPWRAHEGEVPHRLLHT